MICSESGAVDQSKNLVSLFDVLEKLVIQRVPGQEEPPGGIAARFRCRVVAVWLKTEEDQPGEQYKWQIVFRLPPHAREAIPAEGEFALSDEGNFIRILADLQGPPPADGAGTLVVECRLRKAGEEGWSTQEFPIIVEEQQETTNTTSEDSGREPSA